MKIVYVCREYPPSILAGGIATYHLIMSKQMVLLGHEVHVICANDDTRITIYENCDGVHVHRISGGDFWFKQIEPSNNYFFKFRYIYRFWSYRKKLKKYLHGISDVDIVEVPDYGAEALFLLNQSKIPIVIRLHCPSLLDFENKGIQKLCLKNFHYYYFANKEFDVTRRAKYITSCSCSLKDWYLRNSLSTTDIKVVNNPISISNVPFKKGTENNSSNIIMFAGTVCETKGAGDLYEACRLIEKEGRIAFKLVLAGKTGSYAHNLQIAAGEEKWFNLVGKLCRDDLFDLYKKARVICFPSWWENMPMVCLEAMSMGGIVIGSNSGGMSEIINDGENGFLLPPKRPDLWYKKIIEVFNMGEEQRNRISQNAISTIRNRFDSFFIASQMANFYKEVISYNKKLLAE